MDREYLMEVVDDLKDIYVKVLARALGVRPSLERIQARIDRLMERGDDEYVANILNTTQSSAWAILNRKYKLSELEKDFVWDHFQDWLYEVLAG